MKPFFDTLRELRQGAVLDELAEGLHQLVEGVRATGNGGKLTLTLAIKPPAKATGSVIVEDNVEVKLPKPEREATMFFTAPDGSLTRYHPDQQRFHFKPETVKSEGANGDQPQHGSSAS